MTPEDLQSFLDANKTEIQTAVKSRVIEQIIAQHQWDISSEIRKVVTEFVSTEIVPEIKKHLQDQKGPIIQAALVGASEIGANIAKALAERSAKNLTSDSYQFRSVMEAIFK